MSVEDPSTPKASSPENTESPEKSAETSSEAKQAALDAAAQKYDMPQTPPEPSPDEVEKKAEIWNKLGPGEHLSDSLDMDGHVKDGVDSASEASDETEEDPDTTEISEVEEDTSPAEDPSEQVDDPIAMINKTTENAGEGEASPEAQAESSVEKAAEKPPEPKSKEGDKTKEHGKLHAKDHSGGGHGHGDHKSPKKWSEMNTAEKWSKGIEVVGGTALAVGIPAWALAESAQLGFGAALWAPFNAALAVGSISGVALGAALALGGAFYIIDTIRDFVKYSLEHVKNIGSFFTKFLGGKGGGGGGGGGGSHAQAKH